MNMILMHKSACKPAHPMIVNIQDHVDQVTGKDNQL